MPSQNVSALVGIMESSVLEFVGCFRLCPGVMARLVRSVDVALLGPMVTSRSGRGRWCDRDCKSLPREPRRWPTSGVCVKPLDRIWVNVGRTASKASFVETGGDVWLIRRGAVSTPAGVRRLDRAFAVAPPRPVLCSREWLADAR